MMKIKTFFLFLRLGLKILMNVFLVYFTISENVGQTRFPLYSLDKCYNVCRVRRVI